MVKETVEEFIARGGSVRHIPKGRRGSWNTQCYALKIRGKSADRAEKLKELPVPGYLKNYAKQQVENNNTFEVLVKDKLTALKLKFEYQRPIGPYIPDFFFVKENIILEIDGSSHNDKKEYDRQRDIFFRKHGIKTVRIRTKKVHNLTQLNRKNLLRLLRSTPSGCYMKL